jgi:hypothetical protein
MLLVENKQLLVFDLNMEMIITQNNYSFAWEKPCHKPSHDWEWVLHTTYKNGDDWGMVCGIVLTTIAMFNGHLKANQADVYNQAIVGHSADKPMFSSKHQPAEQ